MKVAIIGSGISGLTSAWLLRDHADVTIFERNDYFGGHTDTHLVQVDGQDIAVDSGFIVYNRDNYPHFCHMLDALGVSSQTSDMSLAIDNHISGLSYNPSKSYNLLYRWQNFLRPSFWRMIKDLLRFYREAKNIDVDSIDVELSIQSYLKEHRYSDTFRDEHLYPMCGALWSVAADDVGQLPLKFLLGFLQNHRMLDLKDRPQWLTVKSGSSAYIQAIRSQTNHIQWLNESVTSLRRKNQKVFLQTQDSQHEQQFDAVIIACHAPQAQQIVNDPSSVENLILSVFNVSDNRMVVHTDERLLPASKKLWASWNVSVDTPSVNDNVANSKVSAPQYGIHYWMNRLQNLSVKTPVIASLNPQQTIEPSKILRERHYQHPTYDADTLRAQQSWQQLCEDRRTYYAGAYWGWGFHEDGAASAFRAVRQLLKDTGASQAQLRDMQVDGLRGSVC